MYGVGDINNLTEPNLTTGHWKPLLIKSTAAAKYISECACSAIAYHFIIPVRVSSNQRVNLYYTYNILVASLICAVLLRK